MNKRKTDQRSAVLELSRKGKFAAKSSGATKTGLFFRTKLWAVSKDARAVQRQPPSA